jgi:hypothetical protein
LFSRNLVKERILCWSKVHFGSKNYDVLVSVIDIFDAQKYQLVELYKDDIYILGSLNKPKIDKKIK